MAEDEDTMPVQSLTSAVALPRVTIQFCTQCKWMLRATYVCEALSLFYLLFHCSFLFKVASSYMDDEMSLMLVTDDGLRWR